MILYDYGIKLIYFFSEYLQLPFISNVGSNYIFYFILCNYIIKDRILIKYLKKELKLC